MDLAMEEKMGYRVKTDVFEGPFALMVYLIEHARMSIYDIRIAEITDQYLEYVGDMEKEDLKYCFPEFTPYEGKCRFNGCSHVHEPDCAVKQAVEEKKIHRSRYEDYLAMYQEIQERKRY